MASYYSKSELELWQQEVDGHKEMNQTYQDNSDLTESTWAEQEANWQILHDSWREQHEAWELDPQDPPLPEPVEPLPMQPKPIHVSPTEPIFSLSVYESRVAEQIEEFETPTGPLIVMPGRIILTTADGKVFSVSEQELSHFYIPVEEVVVDSVEK
jgi:hypothetical protein